MKVKVYPRWNINILSLFLVWLPHFCTYTFYFLPIPITNTRHQVEEKVSHKRYSIMHNHIKFKFIIHTPTGTKALLSFLQEKWISKQNLVELYQLISFYLNLSTMIIAINPNFRMYYKIRTRYGITLLVPFLFVLVWSVPGLSPHSLSSICSSSLHLFPSEPCRFYLPFLDKQ